METMVLVVMTPILEVKIIVVLFKNILLLIQYFMVKGLLHTPAAARGGGGQIKDLLVTLSKMKDAKRNHHDIICHDKPFGVVIIHGN